MKRLVYLALACVLATSLSSCALVGSLLQTIGRVPGSLLESVMSVAEAEAEGEHPEGSAGEPIPGQPDEETDAMPSDAVMVVTPLE